MRCCFYKPNQIATKSGNLSFFFLAMELNGTVQLTSCYRKMVLFGVEFKLNPRLYQLLILITNVILQKCSNISLPCLILLYKKMNGYCQFVEVVMCLYMTFCKYHRCGYHPPKKRTTTTIIII